VEKQFQIGYRIAGTGWPGRPLRLFTGGNLRFGFPGHVLKNSGLRLCQQPPCRVNLPPKSANIHCNNARSILEGAIDSAAGAPNTDSA
jgi:hypothetical protein